MPEGLIIGAPISQYAFYLAMFCLLQYTVSKKQHEKYLCNPSSHYGKYGEYTRETRPHVRESHFASISAMSNLFHNIVSKA